MRCTGFSLQWLLLLQSTGSRHTGFSSRGTWAQQLWHAGSRAQAQQLWCTGLVAPWHVGSSQTRARIRVPCIGRRILNHCTTKEAQVSFPCSVFPTEDGNSQKVLDLLSVVLGKSQTFFAGSWCVLFSTEWSLSKRVSVPNNFILNVHIAFLKIISTYKISWASMWVVRKGIKKDSKEQQRKEDNSSCLC